MRIIHIKWIFILIALLEGCTLYQPPVVPEIKKPEHFKVMVKPSTARLQEEWWKNFHDPALDREVAHAIQKNNSYQVALKNIQIAYTYITQNQSGLFPQAELSASSSRNRLAATLPNSFGASNLLVPSRHASIFNLQQLTGTVSYEIDVWNQIRNSVHQAEAQYQGSIADSQVLRLGLVSNVVDAWFQIKTLNTHLANLNQQAAVAAKMIRLTTAQFDSGLSDATALQNAKNEANSIQNAISLLGKQKQVLQYTLAYLSGEYPEIFSDLPAKHSGVRRAECLVPSGIPAAMVANRPDIQSAWFQILAYGYLEKQNIANFLPAISLTGSYGYASNALSSLVNSSSAYWNYGAYATQFLFDYQTRMSQLKRSRYQYEAAILNYRDTVLNAFREVDSALVSYKEDLLSLKALQQEVATKKTLTSIANAQFRSGMSDDSMALADQLSYLQAVYALENQRLAVTQDIIQIYKALGLGVNAKR